MLDDDADPPLSFKQKVLSRLVNLTNFLWEPRSLRRGKKQIQFGEERECLFDWVMKVFDYTDQRIESFINWIADEYNKMIEGLMLALAILANAMGYSFSFLCSFSFCLAVIGQCGWNIPLNAFLGAALCYFTSATLITVVELRRKDAEPQ